jgi:hypothetical protein
MYEDSANKLKSQMLLDVVNMNQNDEMFSDKEDIGALYFRKLCVRIIFEKIPIRFVK